MPYTVLDPKTPLLSNNSAFLAPATRARGAAPCAKAGVSDDYVSPHWEARPSHPRDRHRVEAAPRLRNLGEVRHVFADRDARPQQLGVRRTGQVVGVVDVQRIDSHEQRALPDEHVASGLR